ncbi:MAG: gamma carbonic anhydrase family protein [Elusimicrobiota bacterium]
MIRSYCKHVPRVHPGAFVHDSAEVIGKVELKDRASVYPLCVLRGDVERIVVGERTNIQDLAVVHTRRGCPTIIGKDVTLGHGVIVHGARIGDGALVGMGAILMEAVVGARSLVAAGALVPSGARIPPRSVVVGAPAKVVRRLTERELRRMGSGVRSYLRKTELHRRSSRSVSN